MITQTIDGIYFNMKEEHDFSFLSKYGKVFTVFAKNDSGNISFGTDDGKNRYFLKIAGAKTIESCISPEEAIESLKRAMPIYEALNHPHLIEPLQHYAIGDLYVALFKWVDGDCLFDHWNFEMYSKNPLIQSPKMKFKNLPLDKKLKSIETIFEFLTFVESQNYVAVDFYDGSIMYDFTNDTTTICDIDFFRRQPTFNDMGEKFWGTKRLKAPEEYTHGAKIDTITNVYTLGALIFHLFGKYTNEDIRKMYEDCSFFPCAFENCELSNSLYEIALKAVDNDRQNRYNTLSDFFLSWNEARRTV